MKAAVVTPGQACSGRIADVPKPQPKPGEGLGRGIKGLHGFLAEYYVEQPRYLVKLTGELARVGVLLEPLTIAEKALNQIDRIQSRLVWQPERSVVLGAGPVGLLAALLIRLQDLE